MKNILKEYFVGGDTADAVFSIEELVDDNLSYYQVYINGQDNDGGASGGGAVVGGGDDGGGGGGGGEGEGEGGVSGRKR